jgi:hypothetical protein
MKGICLMIALMLLTAGCGKKSGNTQLNGLLTSTNSVNTAGVQMVVYQVAGYGHLPMPQQQSLRGSPREITHKDDVRVIVDALNNPDGKAFTRIARNNRLALVGQNGQVLIYGIGGGMIQGCDITAHKSSTKLPSVLRTATARARIVVLAPASSIQSISYHEAGSNRLEESTAVAKSQTLLKELFRCYSPLALKGNRHCEAHDVHNHAQRVSSFLTVRLSKPDAIDAIVATGDTEWPPEVYDTSARLEEFRFDTITIFSEGKGLARFVFTDTQSGKCLFTDPVKSLRLVKEAQGRNPPVYGPDLFEEVISEMKKP